MYKAMCLLMYTLAPH